MWGHSVIWLSSGTPVVFEESAHSEGKYDDQLEY